MLISRNNPFVFIASAGLAALLAALPEMSLAYEGYRDPAPLGGVTTLRASVPDKGAIAAGFSFEQASTPDYYRYGLQLAAGVGDGLELGGNLSLVDGEEDSIEDVRLGFKHVILKEQEHPLSAAYILTASFPPSSDEYTTDGSVGAGGIVSKRIGPVVGHLNVLYSKQWDKGMPDEWGVRAGGVFSAARGLKVIAEYEGRMLQHTRRMDFSEARLAYRFVHSDGKYSTIGVGMGLTDNTPNYRIFAALSVVFMRESVDAEDEER